MKDSLKCTIFRRFDARNLKFGEWQINTRGKKTEKGVNLIFPSCCFEKWISTLRQFNCENGNNKAQTFNIKCFTWKIWWLIKVKLYLDSFSSISLIKSIALCPISVYGFYIITLINYFADKRIPILGNIFITENVTIDAITTFPNRFDVGALDLVIWLRM